MMARFSEFVVRFNKDIILVTLCITLMFGFF